MSFPLPVVTVGFPLYSLQLVFFFFSFLLQSHPCPTQAEVLHMLQLFVLAPASSSQRCPMPWALPEDPPGGFSILQGAAGGLLLSLSQNTGVQGPRRAAWQGSKGWHRVCMHVPV